MDLIIMTRLAKSIKVDGKEENKFSYLYHCYIKIADHLVARRKSMDAKVKELQNITARYFVSCLTSPDTFGIENEIVDYKETVKANFPGMGANIEEMMAMAVGGGIMPGQMGNSESLASGACYEFTRMQVDLWECVRETQFILDRQFMASIQHELKDDVDTREMFYQVLFDSMHLQL